MLAGLRVIELSAFVAAPLCGLALAQLGAEVIRIDPPGGNFDIARAPLAPSGVSLYWAFLNAGKRSVELDVRQADGCCLLGRLLADNGPDGGILLTNLPLEGDLSFDSLRRYRQDLIMIQLIGSPDGRSEVDYSVNCSVGFPGLTGPDGFGPINHVLPAWDAIAGMTLATSLLVAERKRRKTGIGTHVRVALSDIGMWTASNLSYIADVEVNNAHRMPDGNYLYGAYGDSFRTIDDRYLMVVAITNKQWRALVKAVDLEGQLTEAARAMGHVLDDEHGRYAAREFISACLRPWFSARSLDEVEAALRPFRVLYGVYRDFQQMVREDPRCSEANPMFVRIDHPGIGPVLTAGTPIDFGLRRPAQPAPRLGQDTDQVLAELAVTESTLQDLKARGVVGGAK